MELKKSIYFVLIDVLYLSGEVDWVHFNVDMSGYYMVHYAGEGWSSIIKLLQYNHTALSSNDRASLIQNIFQLVRYTAVETKLLVLVIVKYFSALSYFC